MTLPDLVPIDDEGWGDEEIEDSPEEEVAEQIKNMHEQLAKERKIRVALFGFTVILVIAAPVVSYLYPSTWTLILAAALAFTIGTNLLISVVTVRVEEKADSMETRMVELLESLSKATYRLQAFHEQLETINIPAIGHLLESVRDEVAPGLNSLEDIDVKAISFEVRRASDFIETLDMEKVGMYLKHIRKEDFTQMPSYATPDPEYDEYWDDGAEDEQPQDDFIAGLLKQEDEERNAVLSRLIG